MRIEALAAARGVEVSWRPFLLGPIFKAQGWSTSPFNVYPAKGRYMIRDIERIAAARGMVFHRPATFPANGLMAARLAIVGIEEGFVAAFSRAVYAAQFAAGQDISDRGTLEEILGSLCLDSDRLFARIEDQDIKHALRMSTSEAMAIGIFGAPTFRTADGEIFWGDDRLDQALDWVCRR
jgi:2-hydroxychromene-2-carboxylate isomerase